VAPPAAGPLAGVGTVRFQTNGTFKADRRPPRQRLYRSAILNLTGNYYFTQDCNFQMTFDALGCHFNGTVVNGGREALFLETVVRARTM
jgi:hypothetical protein